MSADRPGLHTVTRGRGLLFGGDYNPEQWPEHVWAEDAALMRAAGVNLVTVGVFSWGRLEPSPGERDFAWLDRVLDLMHDAGVAVDLATPTASPPPWMGHRWPETLPVDENGTTLYYGARNQWCPSSPVYREKSLEITTALAERYAGHPAVAMWHVGNEYGQVCYCDLTAANFRRWLQAKYHDISALNDAWGTTFWSQHYSGWDEIIPPRTAPYIVNPSQKLDWARFCSDALLAQFTAERDVLRAYSPGTPVTTNYMGFFKPVDYWSWAPEQDVISNDWYPDPTDPRFPVRAALTHDLMRSLAGGTPWMLMEQSTGAVNWRPHNLPKPAGQLRLESLQAVARGADGSCYFQWRQSSFGAERFHSSMVPLAGPDTAAHAEVREHGRELRKLKDVAGTAVSAQVALLHDWHSWWAAEERARPSDRLSVIEQLTDYYHPLWRRGVTADLARPSSALTPYRLVIAPDLFLLSETDAAALTEYVRNGGVLVVGPFSGVADPRGHLYTGRFPAPLREVLGVSGEAWRPVDQPVQCSWRDETGFNGPGFTARDWTETLRSDGADVIATFDDGGPAVTRHRFGAGIAWYVGTIPDAAALAELTERFLADAGVPGTDLPEGVEAVRRGDLLFLLNHGDGTASVAFEGDAVDVLTGAPLHNGATLAPRGVAILRQHAGTGTTAPATR
ncbi:beta-galactosidase [Catenuloplanes indicus]|uniref:Beta-galactosidase n=1 Tax=Catenuloplanes indicus TaxID=137267 RepID=A0AAE3W6N8_9ACTN|nr:beta-galactosidase [Catenuloplanes indicus]MDQ0370853.1 beta-galactosidase [Catenuloplanes indicus]